MLAVVGRREVMVWMGAWGRGVVSESGVPWRIRVCTRVCTPGKSNLGRSNLTGRS